MRPHLITDNVEKFSGGWQCDNSEKPTTVSDQVYIEFRVGRLRVPWGDVSQVTWVFIQFYREIDMPEWERRQEPWGQRVCEGSAGRRSWEALFNHVEITGTSGSINAHRLCVLTYGGPDAGQWARRWLGMQGRDYYCSRWMSCQTDFYIA